MINRKSFTIKKLLAMTLAAAMLTGFSACTNPFEEPDPEPLTEEAYVAPSLLGDTAENTLVFRSDGTLMEISVEDYNGTDIDVSGLETYIKDSITEYNSSNGANRLSMLEYEERDGVVRTAIQYSDINTYNNFNMVDILIDGYDKDAADEVAQAEAEARLKAKPVVKVEELEIDEEALAEAGYSLDDIETGAIEESSGDIQESEPVQTQQESGAVETEPSTASDTSSGNSGNKLLSSDTSYTSDELAKARREAKDKLRDLELNLRESEIKIEKARKALDKGVVTANMNGVVKTAGDPKSPPTDGSSFITVAGSEGLFVRSGIKESKLGTLKEGDIVTVTSWQSGGQYEAEIKSISPYPDNTGMFGGEGTETYFPFTANLLDRDASLQNGDWVEVSYKSAGGSSESGGTMTVPKAFVREEGSKKYVYVRSEDKRLRKQYIVTGTLSDSGYEVLDGLSESDWIAFPYGKNVKDGAKTRESTMGELYN